ncbi:MAG: hypothetical protein IT306_08030 [Chloroflexi bacterium]|nr:hypothetical protein [Chloroflexota bacterium]
MAGERPVGVRAVTGWLRHRLVWASPNGVTLRHGDRVLVEDGATSWLAEVVVMPDQIVEAVSLDVLPRVARQASHADGWPTPPERAGARLLATLGPAGAGQPLSG